ncbi:MAG: hypothetical protein AAGJ73_03265, partial [Pseudomonadota bacterium]
SVRDGTRTDTTKPAREGCSGRSAIAKAIGLTVPSPESNGFKNFFEKYYFCAAQFVRFLAFSNE